MAFDGTHDIIGRRHVAPSSPFPLCVGRALAERRARRRHAGASANESRDKLGSMSLLGVFGLMNSNGSAALQLIVELSILLMLPIGEGILTALRWSMVISTYGRCEMNEISKSRIHMHANLTMYVPLAC